MSPGSTQHSLSASRAGATASRALRHGLAWTMRRKCAGNLGEEFIRRSRPTGVPLVLVLPRSNRRYEGYLKRCDCPLAYLQQSKTPCLAGSRRQSSVRPTVVLGAEYTNHSQEHCNIPRTSGPRSPAPRLAYSEIYHLSDSYTHSPIAKQARRVK